MTTRKSSSSVPAAAIDPGALRDLLGYLNFSQGSVSARFRAALNDLFRNPQLAGDPAALREHLLTELMRLSQSGDAACANPAQAEFVIRFTIDQFLPAYRAHHADLLGHLTKSDFYSPFLVARMFEAVLAARAEVGNIQFFAEFPAVFN